MGIAIQDLLALEFFKDFYVVAGKRGLGKEIQGVTVLDAPDSFYWTKGKELILSNGYVLLQEPECLRKGFRDGVLQKCSGMMLKRERYLEKIPDDICQLFDQYNIPLISMPFYVPYMDIMNQVNTAVMNRTIRRFRINSSSSFSLSNLTYKERKIKRILQMVEAEMHFPALLYDINEKTSFYSSANFRKISEGYGLQDTDYWEPSQTFTRHTLCDYIQMARYRLVRPSEESDARVSWILIPISVNNIDQAYFVVMESRELLDYYDEYSIRIAYLLLQAVYEQIIVAQNIGNIGFENLVHYILDYHDPDPEKLVYQANIQGISLSSSYIYVVFRQHSPEFSLREKRKPFMELFSKTKLSALARMVFLDENEGAFLIRQHSDQNLNLVKIKGLLKDFRQKVMELYPEADLYFGVIIKPGILLELKESIAKCRKLINMGQYLCPDDFIWDYDSLGPLTWLQIPEKELEDLLGTYRLLLKDEKNAELLRTLKEYLENNMNYSLTAEKLYVHINTIRNRIDKVNQLLGIDWDSPLNRMKCEILLQYLKL